MRAVRNSGGAPILMLDRGRNPVIPSGRGVPVLLDGTPYKLDFMKVAVNVAHQEVMRAMLLQDILWDVVRAASRETGGPLPGAVWQGPDGSARRTRASWWARSVGRELRCDRRQLAQEDDRRCGLKNSRDYGAGFIAIRFERHRGHSSGVPKPLRLTQWCLQSRQSQM